MNLFFASSIWKWRPRSRRRSLGSLRFPVAAEILEDRSLLAGDMFATTLEGMLPAGNYTTQLVGNFDTINGDDIASYNETTGQWHISLNNGSGDFTTTAWGTPFLSTSGWQTHLVGDFNGDGRDDIASYHPSNGTWWVNYSTGSNFSPWINPIFYATAAGWQTHLVADFNRDGRSDIASFHPFNGTWWISYGNPAAQNTGALSPGFQEEENQITYSRAAGWQSHLVGNFDFGARPDIASYHPSDGTWHVSLGNAAMTNTGAISPGFQEEKIWADFMTDTGWTFQAVGDFNGDGRGDIVNFFAQNNTFHVSVSNLLNMALSPAAQQTFGTRQWGQLPSGNWTKHLVGDFFTEQVASGTGGKDLASFDSSTGRWYVSLSNGGLFETDVWSDFPTNSGWTHQNVGNFNNEPFSAKGGIMNFHPFNNSLWQSVGHFGLRNNTDVIITGASIHNSLINVGGFLGNIIDVNVRIELFHPDVHSVHMVLISPAGTEVPLFARVFAGGDDMRQVNFDDEAITPVRGTFAPATERRLRPQGRLEDFDGQNPNGTWTLRIVDEVPGFNNGRLDFWDLIIKTAT